MVAFPQVERGGLYHQALLLFGLLRDDDGCCVEFSMFDALRRKLSGGCHDIWFGDDGQAVDATSRLAARAIAFNDRSGWVPVSETGNEPRSGMVLSLRLEHVADGVRCCCRIGSPDAAGAVCFDGDDHVGMAADVEGAAAEALRLVRGAMLGAGPFPQPCRF